MDANANETWEVRPGMWSGWYHVLRNGFSQGHYPGHCMTDALSRAIVAYLNRE